MNDQKRKELFNSKPMAERIAHDVRNCGGILRSDRDLEGRGEGKRDGKRQNREVSKALLVIGKEPGISGEALRKSVKCGDFQFEHMASHLIERGFATVENDCYTLTDKGIRVRKSIEARMQANAANLFGVLTDEEQKTLHGLMEKAVKAWHAAA